METEEAIEIFRDHLNMKDGTEFIWKDWEDAALHILTLATESEQLRKQLEEVRLERDELQAKHCDAMRQLDKAKNSLSFYGNKKDYVREHVFEDIGEVLFASNIDKDCGQRARTTLEEIE